MFCVPEVKKLSDVLLHGVSKEDLVTVWLLAPQLNWMVSPTEALRAKGTKRRRPCVGATITVWVAPEAEIPELLDPLPLVAVGV